jgi:hypothetical protein
MIGPEFHQQLLDVIEQELLIVGCVVTANRRRRMQRVLQRIDRVQTRKDSERLAYELESEMEDEAEEEGCPILPVPVVWFATVECA